MIRLEMYKKRWVIVLLLFLGSVNNYLDRQTLSVLAPYLRDELNLSNVDYSFIVNAFLVAYAIMYSGSGRIIDFLGGRRGVGFCMLAWSVVSALHATATGFLSLALYRFLLGLSEPGLYPGAVKVLSGHFSARDRGLVIGLVVGGTSVGAIIAPPVVVWLLINFGWRAAFLVTGLSGLLLLIAWKLVYRPHEEQAAIASMQRNQQSDIESSFRWLSLFRLPSLWAFLSVRILGDPVWYFILFWLPDYLVKERGFSMSLLGKTAWIPYVGVDLGIILGGLAAGSMIRRGGEVLRTRKLIAVLAAVFVPFGIIASLQVSDPYAIVSLFAIAVFAMGLWMSTIHALPSDLFPYGNVASVYGLGGTAGAFGGIGFISLVGVLADSGLYIVTFWLASLMFPLSVLLLVIFMRPVTSLPEVTR